MNDMDAVILVGGKGTRLQSVISDRPKPMAPVAGRPFVEWLLLSLQAQGFRRAVLCTGHMGQMVEDYFAARTDLGIDVAFSREPAPLGTAGAFRHALPAVQSERFVAMNGDSYCRVDLRALLETHTACRARATLALTPVPDCARYGSVEVGERHEVLAFREKATAHGAGLINAGVYLLERSAVEEIPAGRSVSIETEFFPALIGRGLYALQGEGPFIDIGTPDSYQIAGETLQHDLEQIQARAGHKATS